MHRFADFFSDRNFRPLCVDSKLFHFFRDQYILPATLHMRKDNLLKHPVEFRDKSVRFDDRLNVDDMDASHIRTEYVRKQLIP